MQSTAIFRRFGWLLPLLLVSGAWQINLLGTRLYADFRQDSVFVTEAFKVEFVIENAKVGRFTQPDWDGEGFTVVDGPNFAVKSNADGSNYTMYYRYTVAPFDTGQLYIPTAYFRIDNTEYSSNPVPVISRHRE